MSKLLDFVVRCNHASEDDLAEDILRMADPESYDSKDELKDHFEDCLGYDPFDYFDRKLIDEQYDKLINSAPYSVQEQLRSKRDEIIDRTLDCTDDLADTVLRKVFISVVKDMIGWKPVEDIEVSLDDCISMAIFGDDGIDSEDGYEDDVSEDDEESDDIGYDDEGYDDED